MFEWSIEVLVDPLTGPFPGDLPSAYSVLPWMTEALTGCASLVDYQDFAGRSFLAFPTVQISLVVLSLNAVQTYSVALEVLAAPAVLDALVHHSLTADSFATERSYRSLRIESFLVLEP